MPNTAPRCAPQMEKYHSSVVISNRVIFLSLFFARHQKSTIKTCIASHTACLPPLLSFSHPIALSLTFFPLLSLSSPHTFKHTHKPPPPPLPHHHNHYRQHHHLWRAHTILFFLIVVAAVVVLLRHPFLVCSTIQLKVLMFSMNCL